MKKSLLAVFISITLFSTLFAQQSNYAVYGDIPNYNERYLSPDFISFSNESILISCRTGDALLVLDRKTKSRLKEIKLDGHPSGLAVSPDGSYAYLTIGAANGELLKVDLKQDKVFRTQAGHSPRSVIISKDGKTLYIANQFENCVRSFDAQTLKEKAKGMAIRDAYSLTLSADEKKLFVLNQLPESKGGLYEENIAASVSTLDAQTLKTIARTDLPNGSINGKEIKLSPDGKYAFCTHVVARFNVPTTQVERGWINTNAVSLIDTTDSSLYATFLLDDIELGAANPYGLTFTPDSKNLLVTHSGSHEISVINYNLLISRLKEKFASNPNKAKVFEEICNDLAFLSNIRKRVDMPGYAPRHIVADNNTAFAPLYYSDTLAEIDLERLTAKSHSIGGNETLNEIRRGDLFYHDARLCFQQWLSCTTCHTEVRSDALNWDLLNDGMGNPKQSKSMLYSHFTPPSMITAVRKKAEIAVRKGIQYIQFTRRPEKDAKAIDAYLRSLAPIESPYLKDGLTEAALRGETIFQKAECAHCHKGEFLTDMKRHDVGSGLNEYVGFKFDTPTLIECWRTAPYLYDGRARTIFELFKKYNNNDKHGKTSNLSDEELRDLEAYVLTL